TPALTLLEWRSERRVCCIGVTTSPGRRHDELEPPLTSVDFDFVQFTDSLGERLAARRLLPPDAEQRLAVIVNRPFDGGALFERVRGRPLPPWAAEIGCTSWASYFLKFVVSHPAVTCAIPATSKLAHLRQNMEANYGP